MHKSIKTRLEALERADAARRGECRGWVVLDEGGEVVDGCACDGQHKAYIGVSPDEWDDAQKP